MLCYFYQYFFFFKSNPAQLSLFICFVPYVMFFFFCFVCAKIAFLKFPPSCLSFLMKPSCDEESGLFHPDNKMRRCEENTMVRVHVVVNQQNEVLSAYNVCKWKIRPHPKTSTSFHRGSRQQHPFPFCACVCAQTRDISSGRSLVTDFLHILKVTQTNSD